MSGWASSKSMKIIEVDLCTSAKDRLEGKLSADANIQRLQDYLAGNSVLRAALKQKGHSTGDVIAVDKKGTTLIVYVM